MGIRITRRDVDLAEAIEQELDLSRAADPLAAIEFNVSGETTGAFDASRVREAASNLVSNAAKHGVVGKPIRVNLVGDGDSVTLTVANEGTPIDQQDLPAMFEPFRRGQAAPVHGERTSLGRGLFIVREIAKAHGGEVRGSSTEQGTEFSLQLPRAATVRGPAETA
jgi:signal transduction histidine kinase